MPTIKGKWRWNDTIEYVNLSQSISFTMGGKEYKYMYVDTYTSAIECVNPGVGSDYIDNISPTGENRIADFGEIEQEVSDEFYNFLVANAERVFTIAEKLAQIAENEQKVYDAGYEKGKSEGESYYDTFWDTYQQNGSRRYYERAFADGTNGGRKWIYGTTYKPKYPMKPLAANDMYAYGSLPYEAIAAVDFSECKDFYSTFSYFAISNADKKFPPIDISSATRTQNLFSWATGIKEIEEICVSETTPYSSCFAGTTNLVEVKFNGTIAQKGLSFKDCAKLSKGSIEDVIEHLSDSTGGLTVTFSKVAVDKAYETSEGANDGSNSNAWLDDKLGYRPNWTIALV